MKVGYLDCFSGASGDMIVGAILAAGCDPDFLQSQVDLLGLPGIRVVAKQVAKHGLLGTQVRFLTDSADQPHRSLKTIEKLIDSSQLEPQDKERIAAIFRRIGAAESKAHGIPLEKVHFHEVGALDTICDVAAAVVGFRRLGIEKLYSSALLLGSGVIDAAHGKIPIPSPATQEIALGYPVRRIDADVELTTPTGAAIIRELAEYSPGYEMSISAIGYGAGTRDDNDRPNLLRLLIGEGDHGFVLDRVVVIETSIDDATPEEIGYLQECLFAAGALDVFVSGIMMKKNRPGFLVTVIAATERGEALAEVALRESSTAGVRMRTEVRRKLKRRLETVETEFGAVRIKFLFSGDIHKFSPEYDDVAKAAMAAGVPFSQVYGAALRAAAKIQGEKK